MLQGIRIGCENTFFKRDMCISQWKLWTEQIVWG